MSELEGIESVEGAKKAGMSKLDELDNDAAGSQFGGMMDADKGGGGEAAKFEKVDNVWATPGTESTQSATQVEHVSETEQVSMSEKIGDLKGQVSDIAHLSPSEIRAQSKELVGKLENLKSKLEASKADLKPSYHKVLENRLNHIDDTLKVAVSKAGGEHTAAAKPAAGTSPAQKFIGMLTDSQSQLENLNATIDKLQLSGKNLNPANMLALQVKVGQIQQQVELFTNLLSKALESTKSIMNTQV